jgi:hypothetical protein
VSDNVTSVVGTARGQLSCIRLCEKVGYREGSGIPWGGRGSLAGVAVRKIKADAKLEEFAVQSTAVHKASRPPKPKNKVSCRYALRTNRCLPTSCRAKLLEALAPWREMTSAAPTL